MKICSLGKFQKFQKFSKFLKELYQIEYNLYTINLFILECFATICVCFADFWQNVYKFDKKVVKIGLPPFLLYEEDSSVLKCFVSWVESDIFWQDRSELTF